MDEYRYLHFPAQALRVDERELERLPASARRVFEMIRDRGPMTHADLRAGTSIPPRTIRFAVKRLREAALIEMRSSLRDCRTCYFFVHRRCVDEAALEKVRHKAEHDAEQGMLTLERA